LQSLKKNSKEGSAQNQFFRKPEVCAAKTFVAWASNFYSFISFDS